MAEVSVATGALFDGRLLLAQPAKASEAIEAYGYRVNVDAVHLARFAADVTLGDRGDRGERGRRARPARAALDLGAGVGAVGLALLHLGAAKRVTLIEIDAVAASLARRNAADNGRDAEVDVIVGDVASAPFPRGGADLVVCNPPYVAPGRGRAPAASRARARQGSLDVFLDAARRAAGRRARVCLVYPAGEALTLLAALRARGLEPKRLRAVHARHGGDRSEVSPARIVLVAAAPGKPGGLVIDPPIFE